MIEIDELKIYTPLEEAKEEVWKRWKQVALRQQIKDYLKYLPEPIQNGPNACLARWIATPNYEFIRFMSLSEQVGLKSLVIEFEKDKFYRNNIDKRCLGDIRFNGNGNVLSKPTRIMNIRRNQMSEFKNIKTKWGEPLFAFHHRLVELMSTSIKVPETFDISTWHEHHGKKATNYYKYFLSLFICHGILFENFITNEKKEEWFSKSVVFPAFKQVVEHFGVKPLIVPLVPPDQASDIYWRCYPAELEAEVSRCLSQCNAKDSSAHRHAGRYVGKDSGHYEIKGNRK